MIRMRLYRPGDMARIQMRDTDDHVINQGLQDDLVLDGYALTMHIDGEPVSAFGGVQSSIGLCDIWMITSDKARGHGKMLVKYCLLLIKRVQELESIRRFHCMINSDREENIRFIELLGFERESTMKKAAPDGGDMYMYSRVR